MSTRASTEALYLTNDPEACRLLAESPVALIIGFVLDQQVTVQKAFAGPLELQRRIGTLDPTAIASMDELELIDAFSERPALHRFPAAMARRVQKCMAQIVDEWDGKPERIWLDAGNYETFRARITTLPGFGPGKALTCASVLDRQMHVRLPGWESGIPSWGVLGDVDSPEALIEYQRRKQAAKRAARART